MIPTRAHYSSSSPASNDEEVHQSDVKRVTESRGSLAEYTLQDHKFFHELAEKITNRALGDIDEKEKLFNEFERYIATHAVGEEEVLLPALRLDDLANQLVDDTLNDHQIMRRKVMDMKEAGGPHAPDYYERLEDCIRFEKMHSEKEETSLLPILRKHYNAEQLEEMGARMLRAKATGPTHVRLINLQPINPPYNKVLNPILGVVDHLTDKGRDFAEPLDTKILPSSSENLPK